MYESILVPTDGSEGTMDVLEHALAIAEPAGATVHVLSVVDKRVYLAADDETQPQVLKNLRSEAAKAVENVAGAVRDRGLHAEETIREGIPYRDIIDYANEADVDLIVIGTHGRTGRDRHLSLGSVTDRVVKNADKPVLVARLTS